MVALAHRPHYLLYAEAFGVESGVPRWKFVLQFVGSDDQFSAGDVEYSGDIGRLELLAVVRGLEALDQPSRVTLITRSTYVARGFRRGLALWRDRRWRWERFGQLVPIRDHDLWQRIDRALQFHEVTCLGCPATADVGQPAAARVNAFPERALSGAAFLARSEGQHPNSALPSLLSRTFGKLRDGVMTPLSAFLWPAFTRAA